MNFEGALPDTNDVRALPSQHFAHEASAVSAPTHDLLYGDALLGQVMDGGVGLLAAQISVILDPLGGA